MRQLIFIYGYFAIDSLVKGYYRIYQWISGVELEYQRANDMWNASLMVAGVMVYPSFLIMQRFKILPFDFWDKSIIVVCTVFALIDSMDWFWNFNMRTDVVDWQVFIVINAILIAVKYYFNKKNLLP